MTDDYGTTILTELEATQAVLIVATRERDALRAEVAQLRAQWASVPWEALGDAVSTADVYLMLHEGPGHSAAQRAEIAEARAHLEQVRDFLDANKPDQELAA